LALWQEVSSTFLERISQIKENQKHKPIFTGTALTTIEDLTTLVLSEVFRQLKPGSPVPKPSFLPFFYTSLGEFNLVVLELRNKTLIIHLDDLRNTLENECSFPNLTLRLRTGVLASFATYLVSAHLLNPYLFSAPPPLLHVCFSDEILYRLFSFLPLSGMTRLARTCKGLTQFLSGPSSSGLWREVCGNVEKYVVRGQVGRGNRQDLLAAPSRESLQRYLTPGRGVPFL
jgi:hypothetical protein